jgi:hypothetical protein
VLVCVLCHVAFFTGRSIKNRGASSYATGSLRNYGKAPQPGQIIGTASQPGVVRTVTTADGRVVAAPPNALPLQS